jgi:glycosyltransferase involved in cell wall biosynthesis
MTNHNADSIIADPLISVVIATYNGERFIGKQLDSILNQTYTNIELVVVDDCSRDGTVSILTDYANRFSNIHIYINEKNLGYVKNFEKGMLLAQGDFIAPSDQDDIWLPEKLAILMREIGDNAIVYCDSELINDLDQPVGKKLSNIKQLINFNNSIMFAIGNSAPGHGMLFPKELVADSVPLPTMIPHDHWLGFVATFKNGLKFVNKPLVLYRQHDSNVFGAAKIKSNELNAPLKRKKRNNVDSKIKIRERVLLMFEKCPSQLNEEKLFFSNLHQYYKDFSIGNNLNRALLFFKYRHQILSFKRRSNLRKLLFCIKMIWKIE